MKTNALVRQLQEDARNTSDGDLVTTIRVLQSFIGLALAGNLVGIYLTAGGDPATGIPAILLSLVFGVGFLLYLRTLTREFSRRCQETRDWIRYASSSELDDVHERLTSRRDQ